MKNINLLKNSAFVSLPNQVGGYNVFFWFRRARKPGSPDINMRIKK